MKKFLGPVLSILMGALTFVFLSIPNLVISSKVINSSETMNAWDVLKNYNSDFEGYVFYKIAVIALIVVASLAILSGLVLLLCNTKVIKSKLNFNKVNNCVLTLLVIANVIVLIAGLIFASKLENALFGYALGVGVWFNLALSAIVCLCAWLFAKEVKAKKK